MQHRVTVRANWPEIRNRIDCVFAGLLCYRFEVMYMDESFANGTVAGSKIELTD